MKKSLLKIAVLLAIISMLLMACSSDDKDDKKESSKSSGKKNEKTSGTKKQSQDPGAGDIDDELDTIYSASLDQCDKLKGYYDDFSNAGGENDGFDDILNIESTFTFWTLGIVEQIDFDAFLEKDAGMEFNDEKMKPFQEDLDAFADRLTAVTDAAIDDTQTPEQVEEIHNVVKDFSTYMEDSEFGPCNV